MFGKGGHLHLEEEGRSTKPPSPSSLCSTHYRKTLTSSESARLESSSYTRGVPQTFPSSCPTARKNYKQGDVKDDNGGVVATASCRDAPSINTGHTENESQSTSCCRGEHRHASGVTEAAMHAFHEAMDLVDPVEKAAWAQAQVTCPPSVLEHECCPCYFMAACGGNPWDAAARMCKYWNERIKIFEDRAFEALTLGSDVVSPTGLTKGDVRVLETGALSLLPRDREGRSVIFCDYAKMEFDMVNEVKSRLRLFWYLLQAAYTGGEEQCHRVIMMFACYRPPLNGRYVSTVWKFSSQCSKIPSAMPVNIDSMHFLSLSSKAGNECLAKFLLATTIDLAGSHVPMVVRMHYGAANADTTDVAQADLEAKQNLVQQLREIGFTRKGLPDWAGGLFTLEDFRVWMRRRKRIEQRLFWTDEQRAQQRREVNKIHSREKRTRRCLELEVLKVQVEDLEWKNQQARLIRDRLEVLLEEANAVVDGWNNGLLTGQVHDPLLLASIDRPLEPIHDPLASVETEPLAVHPTLEPDPIPLFCVPTAAQPDAQSNFPSWTDAVRTHLEEPSALLDVSDVPFSLLWQGDEAGEAQQHCSIDTEDFSLAPDPLEEFLNSSETWRASRAPRIQGMALPDFPRRDSKPTGERKI